LNQIATFNERLKKMVDKAKNFEKSKNFERSIKSWIEISEFCINFIKTPNLDISFKNMILQKTRNIINHIKSLKINLKQEKQDIWDREKQEIYKLMQDIPETPTDSPEIIDTSANNESIDEDTISSDQKVKKIHDFKNIPKGFEEIKPPDYNFETIISRDDLKPKSNLKKSKNFQSNKLNSKSLKGANLKKTEIKKEIKTKKTTRACPYCGGRIEINEKICSQCGAPLNDDF
jgi:hypothetical protein